MGNKQSNVTCKPKSTSSKHIKMLQSLEEIIFNLDEENIFESVILILEPFGTTRSCYPKFTICEVIYSVYVSQNKELNVYIEFMKIIEAKEDELINAFVDFLLALDFQESYFLLFNMVELGFVSPNTVKNKILKNDWDLHMKL